jgi:hypothetical protein
MPNDPSVPTSLLQERQLALRQKMAASHPFHEQMALAYDAIGGLQALQEWAEDNPTEFFKLMMKAAPPPQQGVKGGGRGASVIVNIPAGLGPGALDMGVTYDNDPTPDD